MSAPSTGARIKKRPDCKRYRLPPRDGPHAEAERDRPACQKGYGPKTLAVGMSPADADKLHERSLEGAHAR